MTQCRAADKVHYMKLVVVKSNKPFKLLSILFSFILTASVEISDRPICASVL